MSRPQTYYKMIDVGYKKNTQRIAIAMGEIHVGEEAFALVRDKNLPKGDVLPLAEMAGINAAKNTPQLIPLCHPLGLDYVQIYHELEEKQHKIIVYCKVAANAKTGVEMEALAGVNAALLTIYDLVKMVQPNLSILGVRLLCKIGGKKGYWLHEAGVPENAQELLPKREDSLLLQDIAFAVITASDRAFSGEYEDKSGKFLQQLLLDQGAKIAHYQLIQDNQEEIVKAIQSNATRVDVVLTSGGTGISPRDVTIEALNSIADKQVAGIGELLRHNGANYTHNTWLSRSTAAVVKESLVITLPGSTKAIEQSLDVLASLIPHALKMIRGKGH